jgi:hypothetical protein
MENIRFILKKMPSGISASAERHKIVVRAKTIY